jgi:ABC-type phosphate transport system permease subunit
MLPFLEVPILLVGILIGLLLGLIVALYLAQFGRRE